MDDGFHEFATARLGALSRTAYLLTGDHHAAEDLLQDTFERVARRWSRVAASDNPIAYVRRILYHEMVSSWRRKRYLREEVSSDNVPDRPDGRDDAATVDRRIVLRRALARLTPRQRAVIVLRFYEDLSEVDTAAALRCSIGTIKSQTSYALRRLREGAPELADLAPNTPEVTV